MLWLATGAGSSARTISSTGPVIGSSGSRNNSAVMTTIVPDRQGRPPEAEMSRFPPFLPRAARSGLWQDSRYESSGRAAGHDLHHPARREARGAAAQAAGAHPPWRRFPRQPERALAAAAGLAAFGGAGGALRPVPRSAAG